MGGCDILRYDPAMRAAVLAVFIVVPTATAQDAALLMAFDQGRYEEAARLDLPKTADELAFAARAVLAQCMTGPDEPSEGEITRGQSLAREALELDPGHIEGRLQLAIALSLKMRPMSSIQAHRSGHGGEVRDLARSVLDDDPGNAYAHGLLAVWNIEVLRRGGRIGAAMMGADLKSARAHYQAAIQSAPTDASIHWQYARALAALNAKRHGDDIAAALTAATSVPLETALERTMAERATHFSQALDVLGPREAERLAREML